MMIFLVNYNMILIILSFAIFTCAESLKKMYSYVLLKCFLLHKQSLIGVPIWPTASLNL
jgi:hypothetical protein